MFRLFALVCLLCFSFSAFAFELPFDHKIAKIKQVKNSKEYPYYYMPLKNKEIFSGEYSYARYYIDKIGRKNICGQLGKRIISKGGVALANDMYRLLEQGAEYIIRADCWDDSYIIEAVKKADQRQKLVFDIKAAPYSVFRPYPESDVMVINHKNFDELDVKYIENGKKFSKVLKGELWYLINTLPKSLNTTYYELNQNLRTAVKAVGGVCLTPDPTSRGQVFRVSTPEYTYWLKTHSNDYKMQVHILKVKEFKKSLTMNTDDWFSEFEKSGKVTLQGVEFEFNKSTLKPASIPVLKKAVELLKRYPAIVVEVGGHTDNVGNASYNKKLSQQRAFAVRNFLINKGGISPERLLASGYGDEKPAASNSTDEGRQKNRRVELVKVKDVGLDRNGTFESVFTPFPNSKLVTSEKTAEGLEISVNQQGTNAKIFLQGDREKSIYEILGADGKINKRISNTEVKENYISEVQRNHGVLVYESSNELIYRFENTKKYAWVKLHINGPKYIVNIVFTDKE